MNWDLLFKGLNAGMLICSAVLNVYLWHRSRADKRFEAIEGRIEEMNDAAEASREAVRLAIAERRAHVAELGERVSVIHTRIKQMPSHEEYRSLNSKLSAVEERSLILLDGMRRIEKHLLEH